MMKHDRAAASIAICGMECRLPGADGLEGYWKLLKEGRTALGELPNSRLNRELYYNSQRGVVGKSYSKMGGLIPDVPIDRRSLGLPEATVRTTDIAHLTICDVAARALRHAKMDPFNLKHRNVGVYIGSTGGSEWSSDRVFAMLIEEAAVYLREVEEFGQPAFRRQGADFVEKIIRDVVSGVRRRYADRFSETYPDLSAQVSARILTQAFGLTGPSMSVDAACASSLEAMMLGIRALRQGHIKMALVGGASYCKSDCLVLFSAAQSVSARDSRPFDADADGLVSAEGYVALVLKTLDRAIADRDPIYGVIRGVGMSTDGRGKSLWAPRKEGQIVAIERAYGPGIDIRQIQYIEAHATSTQVGDATELSALAHSFAGKLAPGQRIPLGASKANIGHTLETAGIAGLLKVILAMQHATIPPVINVHNPNPTVDWDSLPFFLPRQPLEWNETAGVPRRAAVNAFGIGGLNVHVVVDERAADKSVSVSVPADPVETTIPEPIAVVGMGAILPGGYTVRAFWDLLVSGRDARVEVPANRWNKECSFELDSKDPWKSPTVYGGYLSDYEYDWRKHKVPPKQMVHGNPLQFMLLDATDQALKDAGYDKRPFDRKLTGVVVGTIFGGDFTDQMHMGLRLPEFEAELTPLLRTSGIPEADIAKAVKQYRDIFLKRIPALMDETGSFTSSTLASRITKTFDLQGGAVALDASYGSGLAAVSAGIDVLRSGECDMMICAGAQRTMDLFAYLSLSASGEFAAGHPEQVFDERTRGIVPGEGVGVLLLKRLADARRDGDQIHMVIHSVEAASGETLTPAATETALHRALAAAGFSSADLVALETDGGTQAATAAAIDAATNVLAESTPEAPLVLNSVAGQIGQCGAATGIASLIKVALGFDHQSLPAGIPTQVPAARVAAHPRFFRLPQTATPLATKNDDRPRLAAVIAGAGRGQTYVAITEHGYVRSASTAAGKRRRHRLERDCRRGKRRSSRRRPKPSRRRQASRARRRRFRNRCRRPRLPITVSFASGPVRTATSWPALPPPRNRPSRRLPQIATSTTAISNVWRLWRRRPKTCGRGWNLPAIHSWQRGRRKN